MYCNRCGSPLNAGARFCTACGERVLGVPVAQAIAPAPMSAGAASRVRRHIGLLAGLWMANGILRLLGVLSFSVFGHWFLPGILGPRMLGPWGFPWRGGNVAVVDGIYLGGDRIGRVRRGAFDSGVGIVRTEAVGAAARTGDRGFGVAAFPLGNGVGNLYVVGAAA